MRSAEFGAQDGKRLRIEIKYRDASTLGAKTSGDGEADARAPAGDNGFLALESREIVHGVRAPARRQPAGTEALKALKSASVAPA